VSEVTVSIDPPATGPPSGDSRFVALLRRARERGVTSFDIGAARFPARAEHLIAQAFPALDGDLGVIVRRSVESLANESALREKTGPDRDLAKALEESLAESRRRLDPVPVSVLEWSGEPTGGPTGPTTRKTEGAPPIDATTIFRATYLAPESVGLPEEPVGSSLYAGELSLLTRELVDLFEGVARRAPAVGLIARDPFSEGRLDGSRFAAATALSGPGSGPVGLRQLRAEFDPVLELGFLTRDRRRTLAQAALHYVLDWPWVATVVVPLPSPERFEEILGFRSSAPLDDDEHARIRSLK
jgi:aryl-alcohol dehydrogenase-like predicted oxidoreductase